jgi:hypothetical protein
VSHLPRPWTQAIKDVMPNSTSCDGAAFPDECLTACQAAPFIKSSCESLSKAECAATVALMALESVELKYKHNVYPGRPGQGTANMMMFEVRLPEVPWCLNTPQDFVFPGNFLLIPILSTPQFVLEYATDLFGAKQVQGKSPNDVLAMVMPDKFNFGSAAWFLKKKCTTDVRASLRTGTDDGWMAYNRCVGVDGANEERMTYWFRAKTAFGIYAPLSHGCYSFLRWEQTLTVLPRLHRKHQTPLKCIPTSRARRLRPVYLPYNTNPQYTTSDVNLKARKQGACRLLLSPRMADCCSSTRDVECTIWIRLPGNCPRRTNPNKLVLNHHSWRKLDCARPERVAWYVLRCTKGNSTAWTPAPKFWSVANPVRLLVSINNTFSPELQERTP